MVLAGLLSIHEMKGSHDVMTDRMPSQRLMNSLTTVDPDAFGPRIAA